MEAEAFLKPILLADDASFGQHDFAFHPPATCDVADVWAFRDEWSMAAIVRAPLPGRGHEYLLQQCILFLAAETGNIIGLSFQYRLLHQFEQSLKAPSDSVDSCAGSRDPSIAYSYPCYAY